MQQAAHSRCRRSTAALGSWLCLRGKQLQLVVSSCFGCSTAAWDPHLTATRLRRFCQQQQLRPQPLQGIPWMQRRLQWLRPYCTPQPKPQPLHQHPRIQRPRCKLQPRKLPQQRPQLLQKRPRMQHPRCKPQPKLQLLEGRRKHWMLHWGQRSQIAWGAACSSSCWHWGAALWAAASCSGLTHRQPAQRQALKRGVLVRRGQLAKKRPWVVRVRSS